MADKRNKIFCFMKYFEEWLYIKWTSVICCTAIWEVQFVIKVKCFTLFIVWLLVYLFINVFLSLFTCPSAFYVSYLFVCLWVSVQLFCNPHPFIHKHTYLFIDLFVYSIWYIIYHSFIKWFVHCSFISVISSSLVDDGDVTWKLENG